MDKLEISKRRNLGFSSKLNELTWAWRTRWITGDMIVAETQCLFCLEDARNEGKSKH